MQFNLTTSQEHALRWMLGGTENLFITGGPGTGKSYLIREFKKRSFKKIPVVASTGAAAILVGGRTFHSFFGLGILQGGERAVMERAMRNPRLKKRIKDTKEILIDEVSMLSGETLNCAEKISRALREENSPWGGMRVIMIGDFAQLPPISKSGPRDWAFDSHAWKCSDLKIIELKEVKRTRDNQLMTVLEEMRRGEVSEEARVFFQERCGEPTAEDVPFLFPRRWQTDRYNRARLAAIPEQARIFETEYGGKQRFIDKLKQDAPVPPVLEIKKGALVMIRVNDPRRRFVNGTVGTIVDMTADKLWIQSEGKEIELDPFTFTCLDDDGEEAAYAVNFPITLAYASTIHKIQGATLERAHIDLRNLWEPGQAYVALSRVCHSDAFTLMGWDENSIKTDEKVLSFYEDMALLEETEQLT